MNECFENILFLLVVSAGPFETLSLYIIQTRPKMSDTVPAIYNKYLSNRRPMYRI